MPKSLFGLPAEVIAARQRWVPQGLRRPGLTLLLRTLQGSYATLGLPENTRPVLSQHPTLNSELLDLIRHSRVVARPGVTRFDGPTAHFSDGSSEAFDIVVAATGFTITCPFFEPGFLDLEEATAVPLYRKLMHPDVPTLYSVGLFQPLGWIWPLADHQAKLACAEITGRYRRPADLPARIALEIAHPHYAMDQAPRHSTEVDYHRVREELLAELSTAERA